MNYSEIRPEAIPLALLLEADPCESMVRSYLYQSYCFAALDGSEIAAVCLVVPLHDRKAEIVNVAVWPDRQGQGIGTELLNFVIRQMAEKPIVRIELGTGTFGYQLTYYQKAGFRVESVEKDYFVAHYPQPLYENGIRHRDRLRLALDLSG